MHPREHELTDAADGADARLARALRRLPDPEPPRDGWARLHARLGQREPWRGWMPTAAVAASALLVAVGLLLRSGGPVESPPGVEPRTAAANATPLDVDDGGPLSGAQWRTRSAQLERLLADVPEPRLTRASTGTTAALLEDRIATIDEQLNDVVAGRVPERDADALWRQRTLLLDSLVRVRYAAAVDPGT